jgi:hypothetical protein
MSDLTVAIFFTKNTGVPATALTLSEIDVYLTRQHRATGVDTVIWDGTQNPTEEIDNIGSYIRIYTGADLTLYNYYAAGEYTGATVLDQDWVTGSVGLLTPPVGTAVEFTYTVTNSVTLSPVEGVDIEVSTDSAKTHVVWVGNTDVFGVARDDFGNLPILDPGSYYFWKQKGGFIDDQNPDLEVVS